MKRGNSPSMRGIVLTVALGCAGAWAVDGIAVSIKGAGSGYAENLQGSIERVDIQNSAMVKSQIIYSSADGYARMPCINQTGTKVCFFRDGDKLVNGSTVSGTTDYVAVINIDGTGLENLVSLSGAMAVNRYDYTQGGPDRFIDWPAGDWIYYQKPTTTDIYRVNCVTKADEKVVTLSLPYASPYIGRFNLNSGGNYCSAGNTESTFPNVTTLKRNGGDLGDKGCNHTLSASGRFFSGWNLSRSTHQWWSGTASGCQYPQQEVCTNLINGRYYHMKGHSYAEIINWQWTGNTATRFSLTWNDCYMYRHWSHMIGTQWLQDNIGTPNIGWWSEMPRWSANSDKWLLQSPEQAQCLWNWADRQVVLGARNRKGSGQINDAGDFWVRPPHDSLIGTHYEDHLGVWRRHGTENTSPMPEYVRCPGLTTVYECALKYGQIYIIPQTTYDRIVQVSNSQDQATGFGAATLVPEDQNTMSLVVQPNSTLVLTVTNEKLDGANPVFGQPPNIAWSVVGQNATIAPSTGETATLTTSAGFTSCSVQVTIVAGTVTKTVRKLAFTQAVAVRSGRGIASVEGITVRRAENGGVTVAGPAIRSFDVFRADGERVYGSRVAAMAVTVPAAVLSPGMYVFRMDRANGTPVSVRWLVE